MEHIELQAPASSVVRTPGASFVYGWEAISPQPSFASLAHSAAGDPPTRTLSLAIVEPGLYLVVASLKCTLALDARVGGRGISVDQFLRYDAAFGGVLG